MKLLTFFSFLIVTGVVQAQSVNSDDPANGNLIPEPTLSDYQSANRAPGILVQPFDQVDQDNKPVEL